MLELLAALSIALPSGAWEVTPPGAPIIPPASPQGVDVHLSYGPARVGRVFVGYRFVVPEGVTIERVTCNARIGARRLRPIVHPSWCGWRIPKGTAGRFVRTRLVMTALVPFGPPGRQSEDRQNLWHIVR